MNRTFLKVVKLYQEVFNSLCFVYFSRDQGSKRDSNEEERIQRLFVVVPKWMTDTELYDYFIQFGDLEYANIMRDRDTRESKGFAYVKYFK